MSTLVKKEEPDIAISHEMSAPLSIFDEMDRLTREIQRRAFSFFEERGAGDGWDLSDWFRAESEVVRAMPTNIEEQEKEYVLKAEVPGFEAREISVTVDPHRIRIYGKTEQREKQAKKKETGETPVYHYREIHSNEVFREIELPGTINPELATAQLDKGMLEIHLPKAAPPRLVEVKQAA